MKTSILFSAVLLLALAAQGHAEHNYKPQAGYVPDSTTAIKIAEAVLIPVYGEKTIASEQPFKATLKNGIWIVEGTLNCADNNAGTPEKNLRESCDGGVAFVEISKTDAHILRMTPGM